MSRFEIKVERASEGKKKHEEAGKQKPIGTRETHNDVIFSCNAITTLRQTLFSNILVGIYIFSVCL